MRRLRRHIQLPVVALLLVGGYFLYSYDANKIARDRFFSSMRSPEQIEHIDPHRQVRPISRNPEMTQALAIVVKVFQEAIKSAAGSDQFTVEVRFYESELKVTEPAEIHGGGLFCGSLQLFHINDDHTASPITEKLSLPPRIVCYPDELGYGYDGPKRLLYSDLNCYSSGHVIFVDTGVHPQTPMADRMLTLLDGKLFEDGGDDIRAKVSYHAQWPGVAPGESLPVR